VDAWALALALGFTGLCGFDRAAVVFLPAGLDFAAVVDFGFGFAAVFGFAVVLGLEAVFDVTVDFDFAAALGFDLAAVDFAVEPFDDPAPVRVRGLLCPDLLVAILFPFWSIWPPSLRSTP
jgi:hypothetical protein